jgi:hypothetical protein
MASKKQKRKEARGAQPGRKPYGQARHPDGDRRRRGGLTYEQGLAAKRMLHRQTPLAKAEEEE